MPAQPQLKAYKPLDSAVEIHNSDARVKAICGPVGGGKTSIDIMEILFHMRESEIPTRWIIFRESYPQLRDSTLKTWMEWLPPPISRWSVSDRNIYVTIPNFRGEVLEHEVQLRHARRPEDASSLMSTEYAGAVLEEPVPAYQKGKGVIGAGLQYEIFETVMMRLRQSGVHRHLCILSFNPPPRFHWVYKRFFEPSKAELDEKGWALFRVPAYENEINLPDGYYDDLRQFMSDEVAARFILGECVTLYPGQRVYPECYEQIHLKEGLEPLPGHQLVLMFDFGLTPVCLIGQTVTGGQLRLLREIQLFNAGAKRLGEELRSELKSPRWRSCAPGYRCWGDPAGAQRAQTDERTAFQVLAAAGFEIMPGAVDLESRKIAVKDRLSRMVDGEPALLIDPQGCPMLAEGLLGGYHYGKSMDGRFSPAPLKNQFSHVANALEYGCTGEFSVIDASAKHAHEPRRSILERHRIDPFRLTDERRSGSWMSK